MPTMAAMSSLTVARVSAPAERANVAAVSLGFAVVQLDVTVVNVAIGRIGSSLGGGMEAMQWVVAAYTMVMAALILPAGALGDRFGARRMFLLGFAVFAVSSAACAGAPSIPLLIAARAVQGAGAALLGACSLALINHTFARPAARARAIGWYAAGASMALSGGPVVGGLLLATAGWRAIFLINVPIAAAGSWLAWRHIPESPASPERRLDTAGAATAVLALGVFAAAAIESGSTGIADPGIVAGLGAAAVLAVAFLWVERRAAEPMLPLALLRSRGIALCAAIGLGVNAVFYGLIFVFSLLWQSGDGFSPLRTGLAFLPMTAAIMAANLLTARLGRRIGPDATILAGLGMMAAACGGLLWAGAGAGYAMLVGPQLLLGAGLGALVPPLTGRVLAGVEPSRSGVASGALVAARQAGSVLGVAVFGSLVMGGGVHRGTDACLAVSIAVLALCGLAAVPLAA